MAKDGGRTEADAMKFPARCPALPPGRRSLEKPRRRDLSNLTICVGTREIARWVRLHEARRLEIVRSTDEQLTARFARAMGQIDERPTVRRNRLAAKVDGTQ